jgi:hypothetical protein
VAPSKEVPVGAAKLLPVKLLRVKVLPVKDPAAASRTNPVADTFDRRRPVHLAVSGASSWPAENLGECRTGIVGMTRMSGAFEATAARPRMAADTKRWVGT